MTDDRLLTIAELAAKLGVKPRWVMDNTAPRGAGIPSVMLGRYRRFRWVDVEAWLEERKAA